VSVRCYDTSLGNTLIMTIMYHFLRFLFQAVLIWGFYSLYVNNTFSAHSFLTDVVTNSTGVWCLLVLSFISLDNIEHRFCISFVMNPSLLLVNTIFFCGATIQIAPSCLSVEVSRSHTIRHTHTHTHTHTHGMTLLNE
jgi:hypothetical protein